jgi:hypothetical protein
MPKRTARKLSSEKNARTASSDTLKALEQKVIAIAEQLGRIAAAFHEKADSGLSDPAFESHLAQIRARVSKLLERVRERNGDKYPDELISKALTTRRRRSGRPREG